MVVAPFPYIRCWARMCACRRNRSATFGKGRSAPPPSPGWAITRSAMWPCFRGRLTARWRWRPRTLCWARLPRSATSASSRRCCWMSRPRSAPRRRCHRRASSTSPWRPIRGANKRGKLPQSYMPQRMSSHLRTTCLRYLPRIRVARTATRCASALDQRGVQYGPAFTGLGAVHTGEGEAGTVLAEVALPRQIRSQQDAYGVHPALLDACFQSVEAHPDVQALGEGVLGLPLGVRRLRSYACCPQRPLLLHTGDQSRRFRGRGRHRRARRARGSPARRAGPAIGHRSLREGPQRSGAGRAAADHRMAATRIARAGTRRRRNLAADQHHQRRSGGHRVDRCPEKPWRAMHHHVLATARRPHLKHGTAWQIICVPVDSPVW